MKQLKTKAALELLEMELLLTAVHQYYGYDFNAYAQASMLRRIKKFMTEHHQQHISDLIALFLHSPAAFAQFLNSLSVIVTEMFRNPNVFKHIRSDVIPVLQSYPFVKIWHAGCATGQEAYSLAIVLAEEGLLDRCQIYATDFNEDALDTAKAGIYPEASFSTYEQGYLQAGGAGAFNDYWVRSYGSMKINQQLADHITFANHNLVTDGVFGEMHFILCRNVLIYFNETLQNEVLKLLYNSLVPRGFLCIGAREVLKYSSIQSELDIVHKPSRIYRKKGAIS